MDLSGNGDPSSICTVMRSDGTSLYATRFVSYVKVIPIRMCVWLHGLCSRIKAKTIFLSSKLLPSPSSKSFILITQNIFIGFLFIASYNSWKGLILSEVIENCSQLVKHHRIFTAEYIVLHTLKLRYLIITSKYFTITHWQKMYTRRYTLYIGSVVSSLCKDHFICTEVPVLILIVVKQAKGKVCHVTYIYFTCLCDWPLWKRAVSVIRAENWVYQAHYSWDKATRKEKIGHEKSHISKHSHTQALLEKGSSVSQVRVLYCSTNHFCSIMILLTAIICSKQL